MLVQFSFKNFGPFREEAVFDMRAVKSYKEHNDNLIEVNDDVKILRTAAVYGANAGGKSSFLAAYDSFSRIVKSSFNNSEEQESIIKEYYNPFLFDNESRCGETEFDAVYIDGNVEYHYGFTFNQEAILYEWIYKKNLNTNRKSTLVERKGSEISLGASVKKSCGKYVEQIEKDVLVLSFFNRLKLETDIFSRIYACIAGNLVVRGPIEIISHMVLKRYFRDNFHNAEKKRLLSFLHAADVGIKDIKVLKNNDEIDVFTFHENSRGERYEVSLNIESDGTKKIIAMFYWVNLCRDTGSILFIDELNSQLHPLMMKYIIDCFYEGDSKGQLVYTTHDTTLLDRRYFRRDQVWFVEKNSFGEASLYSLAEFKIRGDASFEKEYLGGVYGGIPILKDLEPEE